jgi:elongation factor G
VEVERSLRVLDGAVAVFCAVGGVEPQSETVWRQADKYRVPRLAFINKMDRVGADFFGVVQEIKDRLGANPVPMQIPLGSEENFKGIVDLIERKAIVWKEDEQLGMKYDYCEIPEDLVDTVEEWREKLVEAVCISDDDLLNKFLEDRDSISVEEFMEYTRRATISMEIVPVLCGSAFKNKGIQRLLDAISDLLPSPVDVGAVKGIDPRNDQEITREPRDDEPMTGLVFKIATDPFVGRLAYVRVYSGKLQEGVMVYNNRTEKKDRISRIYQMHANKQNPKKEIGAGDICAVVGLKDLRTGDTITSVGKPMILEAIEFPEPVIGIAIEPKTQADIDKLGIALNKLAEEDPTFQIRSNVETGQTTINGMGELHLEILLDRLKREFKVECNVGAPQVNYKEALTTEVKHREVFKKQTGGRGKYADIEVVIGPASDHQKGLEFKDEVRGGNIPREFIPSVEKGFNNAMFNGPLAGFPVEGLKVRLIDGSFHSVDSDQLSFEICARQAFKHAASKANPVMLEPIMSVEVVTPEEYMGDVISDLNKRRGQVEGMDSKAGARVIKAKVPLAEQFGYVTVLRTLSSGRASSTMEFSHYEQMPPNLAKEILEKVTGKSL